jgi:xanthine dehydrogenase/oxidase
LQGDVLLFYVNGVKHELTDVQPEVTLLEYLRSTGLTGTKLGCGEVRSWFACRAVELVDTVAIAAVQGGCGACTVMLSSYDVATAKVSHRAINACLAPLCSVHWCAVTTVEGIGSIKGGLHPVQGMCRSPHHHCVVPHIHIHLLFFSAATVVGCDCVCLAACRVSLELSRARARVWV